MTSPTPIRRFAVVLGLTLAASALALPPVLNPGQPVDFRGPLCLRENADGSLGLGVWIKPGSRSRAYRPLNVPPREFRNYPCPVEFKDPFDAPRGYYEAAPIVHIQGIGSSRVADNGYERYVDVHHVSSSSPVVPMADCPAFAKLAAPPVAKPMASLEDTLYRVAVNLGGSEQDREMDRRSIARLLRRGLGVRLAEELGR